MLEDPRVNFAISTHSGRAAGIDHLGIQVEDGRELQEVHGRLQAAEGPVLEEGRTTCCYAQSEKSWIADPSGVAWEAFHTTGESTVYGTSAPKEQLATGACCGPTAETHRRCPRQSLLRLSMRGFNILFLCTGNSARSILAESIVNRLGNGPASRPATAPAWPSLKGTRCTRYAIDLLGELRLSESDRALHSKSWDVFAVAGAPHMDFVFTVCDDAAGEASCTAVARPVDR